MSSDTTKGRTEVEAAIENLANIESKLRELCRDKQHRLYVTEINLLIDKEHNAQNRLNQLRQRYWLWD